jgi:hypothetical protein
MPQIKGAPLHGVIAAIGRICCPAPSTRCCRFCPRAWPRRGDARHRLFARYYDTGTLSVPTARAGHCEAHYRGCVGFDRVLWET